IPSYEAISYTWGNANLREHIWVNGKALNVPKSCYTILSNRSSVWKPQLLWIDAVCINQKDEDEKNTQVPLMRDIYTKAFIVSVCLQTSEAPEEAIPQLHEMTEAIYASDMVLELAYRDLKTVSSELEVYRQYYQSIRMPRWLAFQALVRNPWFTRIWVVQEVALASSIRV
ncbi:heterokaryon incompatibility, partial [Stipitochalara longipes BDJ]